MIEQTFREYLINLGFSPPDYIEPDKRYRFPSPEKGSSNKSAVCYMFPDGIGGYYKDYVTGIEGIWQSKRSTPFTKEEKRAFQESITRQKETSMIEDAERREKAEILANKTWHNAAPEIGDHKYLRIKNIQPHGTRTDGSNIVVPIFINNKIASLQTIDPNGTKRYLQGGRIKGGYYPIGKPNGVLRICEGFATGATLHEATGDAVAVAFDAGNLVRVAVNLREKYPDIDLIICADDDWKTDGNPGVTKASEAALKSRAFMIFPEFHKARSVNDTDFNDMAMMHGLDSIKEVKLQDIQSQDVSELPETEQKLPIVLHSGMNKKAINPRGWIVSDLILHGHVTAIFAEGGTGKSIFAIQLAMAIAAGKDALGLKIQERCPTLTLNNEDDESEMLRRLVACREHAGYSKEDIDQCYASSGYGNPIKFACMRNDAVVVTNAAGAVTRFIAEHGCKVLFIDPFISTHEVEENNNGEMDKVMTVYKRIAKESGCAIVLVHHMRKQGDGMDLDSRAGNADSGRGASSMKDACRIAMTLTRMGKKMADDLEISIEDRLNTIRLDIGKGNYSSYSSVHGRWMRFISYGLGNSDDHNRTDYVGLLEPFSLPDRDMEESHGNTKWTPTAVTTLVRRYFVYDAESVTYSNIVDDIGINLGLKKTAVYDLLNKIPEGDDNAIKVVEKGEYIRYWRVKEAIGWSIYRLEL